MRTSRSIYHTSPSPITPCTTRPRSHRFRVSESSLLAVQETPLPKSPSRIKQLKSRLKVTKPSQNTSEITSKLAARVVRQYILPMFESETRSKQDTLRSETFRHKRVFSTEGNTVYSELKLSDRLNIEIQTLEGKLTEMNQVLKDNIQEKEKILIENQRLELELLNMESNVKVLLQENFGMQRELAGIKLSIGHLSGQLSRYREMYEASVEEQKELGKVLSEEKAINAHKTKTRSVQLEYESSLMQLEKEIMADRITGLYKALDHIVGAHGIQVKLVEESKVLNEELKNTSKFLDEASNDLVFVTKERDLLRSNYVELDSIKDELTKQRDRTTKLFKEKFGSMQKELNDAVESREFFKAKQEEIEKKYLDIMEEFKKFRQKMKVKYSKVEGKDEKFCMNCQKSFFDSENFNWSCRTHASKVTGDMYWCCGKSGKDSVGCIVSKHISKGEDEMDQETLLTTNNFCSACKEIGHTLATCFRDPNLRTNADLGEEKKRLEDIKKYKKRTSQSFELQNKISAFLSNKSAMLHENYITFDDDDFIFDDLKEIKEEVDFEDAKETNLVVLEQKLQKKEEVKRPLKQKTGLSGISGLSFDS